MVLTMVSTSAGLRDRIFLATREALSLFSEPIGGGERQFCETVDLRSAFLRGLQRLSVLVQMLCSWMRLSRECSLQALMFDGQQGNKAQWRDYLIRYGLQQISHLHMDPPKPYRSKPIRFLVLFLVSMVVFGNQYAFNNPQALEDSMEKDLGIGETQFQMLYTIFAFPNIFATFIIGFLIDFLGVRTGIIALAAGVAIFQLVIAIGGYAYSYTTILIGRMMFGLASESLITAQASMVSFWFKGKELAFALGIAVTFPELGNALNSYVTPIIYENSQSLGTPLLVSVFICILGVACALSAAYIDKKADTEDLINKVKVVEQTTEAGEVESEQIKCEDLKKLKGSFWLVVVLCMFAVGLYVPFLDGANKMYQVRFCFTQVTSGKALVVTYLVAAVFSTPLGLFIDKVGYKRYFMMVAMGIFTIAQFIILVYPQCKDGIQLNGSIVGLAFIGLGYCFYGNCILPAIPLVVKKKVTGTAFGIMQMIESIALAFFPLINGALVQHASSHEVGYRHSSLFFVIIGLIGLLTSFGMFFISDKVKKKLDHVSKTKMKVENKDGQVIYSESETQKSSPSEAEIEIVDQKSTENMRTSLLNESQKKQVRFDL